MPGVASSEAAVSPRRPVGGWAKSIRCSVLDPDTLCELAGLDEAARAAARSAAAGYPVRVPPQFFQQIEPGRSDDPLLLQVLPTAAELRAQSGFSTDPLAELAQCGASGLVRKYAGRMLMMVTDACAINCRYCFRRHYRAKGHLPSWPRRLAELCRALLDRSVTEVILSGGDPLMLPDRTLGRLVHLIAAACHVRRIRIHTRMPTVVPERVGPELLRWLTGTRLRPVVVVHCNHSSELSAASVDALGQLVQIGVTVLNQSVLLRGINDEPAALAELCQSLVDCGVLPYYLHQLDRVAGAAHFEVPVEWGIELMVRLRAMLPGYAVPRYVRQEPGRPSKTVIA